ncbi:MAG: DUF4382 domain-containing protein [Woeseiaceae bacterium]|nr:DUF4382 domain-containing protein [Woeseiaceae bacterium]
MDFTNKSVRLLLAMLATLFVLSSCGGSGNSGPTPTTGTVALLFTDRPTDEFSAIKLDVVEAILIGGNGVAGQQVLFRGSEPIDLLDLTNYSEPIVFGEVEAGIYTKLRLVIDNLELVPNDGGPSQYPALPANGRIDLLDPRGIEVLPGRTLLVELDMEANKALHIVGAGNSGRYQFRPIVKATFTDGDAGVLPLKLARLEGTASDVDGNGDFTLCDIETPDSCVGVSTDSSTSIFGSDGTPTGFGTLMNGDTVVVIGSYTVSGGITLNAVVLEIGGNASQVRGQVVSSPANEQFLVLRSGGEEIVVELQQGTRFYDENGELDASAIAVGADVEVEGVMPPKADAADPDLIRAALVFVVPQDDEQAAGTIIEPLDAATRSFGLTGMGGGDICVRVDADADILLVDIAASEVTMGTFADLALGQVVELFGVMSDCFDANEVIVDLNAGP